MMKVLIFFGFIAHVLAAEILLQNRSPIELVYRRNAGALKQQISAKLSLECLDVGDNMFEVSVSALDQFIRAARSSLSIGTETVTGRGDLKLTLPLAILDQAPRDNLCDGTGGKQCGVRRSGTAIIRQYIEVPDTVSKLHWTGFYDVAFECNFVPLDPKEKQLVSPSYTVGILEQCTEFGHTGFTQALPSGAIRVTIDMERSRYYVRLDSCAIRVFNGIGESVIVPFVQNGIILNTPGLMATTGKVIREGKKYSFDIRNLKLQLGESTAALTGLVECKAMYCRDQESENLALPLCPTSSIPNALPASRSLLSALGERTGRASDVELQYGSVILTVQNGPARSSGSVIECVPTPATV